VGYDEVAHYSGPDTYESQITLATFDRKLRRLLRLMRHGAPITYEVALLSDHGQTPSVPFQHLYGRPLQEVLVDLAGQTATTPEVTPLDAMYVTTLLEELRESHAGEVAWTAARSRRTLERLSGAVEVAIPGDAAEPTIIVQVSGCLAHIYFEGAKQPLNLEEIRQLYPGLVEGLASHPGIGFVAARGEGGAVVAIGTDGLRDLTSGTVRGEADPLAPYGQPQRWEREIRQLVGYPSAGDLIVNGSLLDDGRVVVMEEQISSHGGMGGAQTEPFFVAPADWNTQENDLESPESLHAHLLPIVKQIRRGKADLPPEK
jgi:hypothetical protein